MVRGGRGLVEKSYKFVYFIFIISILLISSLYFTHCENSSSDESICHPQTELPETISNPFEAQEVFPFYETRIPTAYDVTGQPGIVVTGALSTLYFENTTMMFRRDFTGASAGTTFVIFTLSTAGVTLDPDYALTINLEADGACSAGLAASSSQITISILYAGTTWVPIHTVTSQNDAIDRVNGWYEYVVPLPFSNYLVGTDFKVKVELTQQLKAAQTWAQRLYLRWLTLELQKDVGLNMMPPTKVTLLTSGFTSVGNLSCLGAEDGLYYRFSRVLPPGGETGQLQFFLEYNLGYYGIEPLLGLRFAHYDWFHVEGIVGGLSSIGRILINKSSGNSFLCLTRADIVNPAMPDIRHACVPTVGDWRLNNSIRLLFSIDYTVISTAATVQFLMDWARLQIVRQPAPITLPHLLNSTIYANQEVWLNITCLDGKAPITEIRIQPWNEVVGTTAGTFLYHHPAATGGQIALSLNVKDAEGDQYVQPIGTLTVLYRPISIALYLSEDPYLQEFVVQLLMKDIFWNTPLPLHPFIKTILKNGTLFRQQAHQTTMAGAFLIHESVLDYLDWNYTVSISAPGTSIYEATSVQASIILSKCPPVLTINRINYSQPLKANDPIRVNYTVQCLTALDELWLCKNGSLFLPLTPTLGTHNFTFRDVGGTWEYYLYANNSQHFQAYSSPFKLKVIPLKTTLQLESTLDMESHAIALEIQLYDELNRTCPDVPLQVTIFDGGKVFYDQRVTTGMAGVDLIIHFDQYLDHAFTVQITSESTPIYKGTLLTASNDLSYSGYPLYWIIALGIMVGVVSVLLCFLKRRFEFQNE